MNQKNQSLYLNHLAKEKSPYLLQHSHNPVCWYPWGTEAFDKAFKEDKPIFLSIGYSTCHWCHVMAHESFEDPLIGEKMNELFISIKVDREEQPDVDQIYMTVCQLLTGTGGWPLTIVMTPEKKPFFAATYLTKTGMQTLMEKVENIWKNKRRQIEESAKEIVDFLKQESPSTRETPFTTSYLSKAFVHYSKIFDDIFGGFGISPKFPAPHNLFFLLRYWYRTKNQRALEMVEKTLTLIRNGGIYDHIGFGFHRYSTDKKWIIPHFEKMLYDQALLLMAYVETFQATQNRKYANTAKEIISYVQRELKAPEGAFFSAEDSETNGIEGKYYLWTFEELQKNLTPEELDIIVRTYNVKPDGNYMEESTGRKNGTNIFYTQEVITDKLLLEKLALLRQKLFELRSKRNHPFKDTKILTDWNSLMIAGLAKAYGVFQEKSIKETAESAMKFILKEMFKNDIVFHRYKDGEVKFYGILDDYSFLVWALLELYEITFNPDYMHKAIYIYDLLINEFWDQDKNGFFFQSKKGEPILFRSKEWLEGAKPSGNSVAMYCALKLFRFTNKLKYQEIALQAEHCVFSQIMQAPSGYPFLLSVFEFMNAPSFEIIIAGDLEASKTHEIRAEIQKRFIPHKILIGKPDYETEKGISSIADYFSNYRSISGEPAAVYICKNFSCRLPLTDLPSILQQLETQDAGLSSQN